MSTQISNIIDKVRQYATDRPNKLAYVFLDNPQPVQITFRSLHMHAMQIAGRLHKHYSMGQRLIILLPAGVDFICAYLGCLYAGIIAIPVNCMSVSQLEANADIIKIIYKDVQAESIISNNETINRFIKLLNGHKWINVDDIDEIVDNLNQPINNNHIAHVLYSSGSTANPKGIITQHAQLSYSLFHTSKIWRYTSNSRTFTWAPHSHVYGLICGLLVPLYNGSTTFVISPLSFITNPRIWFDSISQYKITHTGGPNFCFDLCNNCLDVIALGHLRLDSLKVMVNGGEIVQPESIRLFIQYFSQIGICEKIIYPAYGMTELTGLISCRVAGSKLFAIKVSKIKLSQGNISMTDKLSHGKELISNGKLMPNLQGLIIDPNTDKQVSNGKVGEVCLTGPPLMKQYWNQPQNDTVSYIKNKGKKYFRTGDLGFFIDDELFICGRCKDLIILHGMKYLPQDIENAVLQTQSNSLVRHAVAFSVEIDYQEQLVILLELNQNVNRNNFKILVDTIRNALFKQFAIDAYAIVILPVDSLCRTPTGKIRRQLCRKKYTDKSFTTILHLDEKTINREHGEIQHIYHDNINHSLINNLKIIISSELKIPIKKIDINQDLSIYGMDSITITRIIHHINQFYGINISPEMLIDMENINDITQYLIRQYGKTIEEYYRKIK